VGRAEDMIKVLLQTEGTAILHLISALKQDPALRKEFVKSLKVWAAMRREEGREGKGLKQAMASCLSHRCSHHRGLSVLRCLKERSPWTLSRLSLLPWSCL